jgi:hypothetical protein
MHFSKVVIRRIKTGNGNNIEGFHVIMLIFPKNRNTFLFGTVIETLYTGFKLSNKDRSL